MELKGKILIVVIQRSDTCGGRGDVNKGENSFVNNHPY